MRREAGWMQILDERILEHLAQNSPSTPEEIDENTYIRSSRRRIACRCRALTDAGLIAPDAPRSRVYELTIWGQLYLEGKIDARHQPKPDRTTLARA